MAQSVSTTFTCDQCGAQTTVPGQVAGPIDQTWVTVTYHGKQYLFHSAACAAAWLAAQ